jgi:hypothetical protein
MEKRQKRNIIVLATLLVLVAAVFGWDFVGRARSATNDNAAIAKLVAANKGKVPQFPFFHPPAGGFHRVNWRKMTAAQRRAFHNRMRVRFEAFLLEFAQASPAVQQEIVAQAKARFRMMRKMHAKWAKRRQGAGGANGHPGGPHHGWGPGGLAQHAPAFIAHALVSGNPQMHAAATQFFMALHNG